MTSSSIAFTAPHFASSQVGLDILKKGGTAIEAMVAAAASIAVQYPHMNGLGGDGFWLISEPGKEPVAIDACGVSASDLSAYEQLDSIPSRGPLAAVNMAGAVSGWQLALQHSGKWQSNLPLSTLLDRAISQANWGIEVTQSLSNASHLTYDLFKNDEHFAPFLIKGNALKKGKILKLKTLANTLQCLVKNGLDDFYRGEVASLLAGDLAAVGSPLQLQDFHDYRAQYVKPLQVSTNKAKLYNLPAPTQGVASLIILALYDRLSHTVKSDIEHMHLLIECTKQAFMIRNQYVSDPSRTDKKLYEYLNDEQLDCLASNIKLDSALEWPHQAKPGDTIWMGACDSKGRMVSYIQSLYWEFGSGVVSPSTGIVWNNRGTSFSLEQGHLQLLRPKLKPFHTLNPAFAELNDGRRMAYGTMGGEGQPQTQAAIFTRYFYQNMPLDKSIAKGRWLLGRTWGDESHNLKVEKDIAVDCAQDLRELGHDVAIVDACNELMGHAGAIVLHSDGELDVASDPRSDGEALTDHYSFGESD